jgi:hypothetical protein
MSRTISLLLRRRRRWHRKPHHDEIAVAPAFATFPDRFGMAQERSQDRCSSIKDNNVVGTGWLRDPQLVRIHAHLKLRLSFP